MFLTPNQVHGDIQNYYRMRAGDSYWTNTFFKRGVQLLETFSLFVWWKLYRLSMDISAQISTYKLHQCSSPERGSHVWKLVRYSTISNIWLGTRRQLLKLHLPLLTNRFPSFTYYSSIRDLGAILDSSLTISDYTNSFYMHSSVLVYRLL